MTVGEYTCNLEFEHQHILSLSTPTPVPLPTSPPTPTVHPHLHPLKIMIEQRTYRNRNNLTGMQLNNLQ